MVVFMVVQSRQVNGRGKNDGNGNKDGGNDYGCIRRRLEQANDDGRDCVWLS